MYIKVKSPKGNISSSDDIQPDTIYVGYEVSDIAFIIGNKDNTRAPLYCLYDGCAHICDQSWEIVEED